MYTRQIIAVGLLSITVAVAAPVAAAEGDADGRARTMGRTASTEDVTPNATGTSSQGAGQTATRPLKMREVIDRIEKAGYSNVREIERDHGQWEVDATDQQGRHAELHVNARTGAIRRDD